MKTRNFRQGGTVSRRGLRIGIASTLALIGITAGLSGLVVHADPQTPGVDILTPPPTNPITPIQHLVVIYGENISYDHYFGTYPNATNVAGEPFFIAKPNTPTSNNYVSNPSLLTNNPNSTNAGNGANAINPFRLDRTQAVSGDQGHSYTPEQKAADNGAMDLFPVNVGNGTSGGAGAFGTKGLTMGYFDGNTVTGFWNYAQGFAMSDNSFGDQYGPSTPGALNVISGQTNGMVITHGSSTTYYVTNGANGNTMINDSDPDTDTCSVLAAGNEVHMTGHNIGDLLNTAHITWGSFMGGFNLNLTNTNGTTNCARSSANVAGSSTADYIQHHAWFQYYASTINATHARPQSLATIGHSFETDGTTPEPANHEYDLLDFYAAVKSGNFPAVSFIKMPAYQDAHAGYSDPLDEQQGVVALINFLQQQPGWNNTAVIIAYDDSDGWYDHAFATITSPSFDATADQVNGAGVCGTGTAQNGLTGQPVNGRCGPGPRLPFMVISPWAKPNYISHVQISQVSVTKFIEDNWLSGQRLGAGSFDANAGSIMDMFNFDGNGTTPSRFLNPITGSHSFALSHDFANGGFSDILWRDTAGDATIWMINNGQISSGVSLGNIPNAWSVVGSRDFDGDGYSDILWRDTSGDTTIWFMKGGQVTWAADLGNTPTTLSVAGTGDFNGDGKADILWRDTSGNTSISFMNGGTIAMSTSLGNVPIIWSVAGTGDFNGDGVADILWHDANGDVTIWLMSGGSVMQGISVGNLPTNWSIVGTGDFNGDGITDILWRDTAGDVLIWLMNSNGTVKQQSVLGNVPTNMSVAETGDFNGDGNSDIVWLDTSGNLTIWYMNGLAASAASVANVGTAWSIAGTNAD